MFGSRWLQNDASPGSAPDRELSNKLSTGWKSKRLGYLPAVQESPRLARIAARRLRFALSLTAVTMTVYFGFILLVAFDKPLLGRLVSPGLSVGIVLGALVILASWLLTFVYVRWANGVYDTELAGVRVDDATAAERDRGAS